VREDRRNKGNCERSGISFRKQHLAIAFLILLCEVHEVIDRNKMVVGHRGGRPPVFACVSGGVVVSGQANEERSQFRRRRGV